MCAQEKLLFTRCVSRPVVCYRHVQLVFGFYSFVRVGDALALLALGVLSLSKVLVFEFCQFALGTAVSQQL